MAKAESAAADARMVIATCSLMSEESSEGLDDNLLCSLPGISSSTRPKM